MALPTPNGPIQHAAGPKDSQENSMRQLDVAAVPVGLATALLFLNEPAAHASARKGRQEESLRQAENATISLIFPEGKEDTMSVPTGKGSRWPPQGE